MKCPVCKKEVETDVIKCPHCNARIGIHCKHCNTINFVQNKKCKNCGEDLLKFCPICKAANFPDAVKCRKCGEILDKNVKINDLIPEQNASENINSKTETVTVNNNEVASKNVSNISQSELSPENNAPDTKDNSENIKQNTSNNFVQNPNINGIKFENTSQNQVPELEPLTVAGVSQNEAKILLKQAIYDDKKHIISLIGNKGFGKSTIIRSLVNDLNDPSIMCLVVECTQLSQLTAGGFLQSLFLNIFNLPSMCINSVQFQKSAYAFIKKNFSSLTDFEIYELINFLYPANEGNYEEVHENKIKTFNILNKVLNTIIGDSKCIFVIDNFQYTDGFSYEFMLKYLRNDSVYNNVKLVLTYDEYNPVKGKFYLPEHQDEDYTSDIVLAPLEYREMIAYIKQKKSAVKDFPPVTKPEVHQIFELSKGNPAFVEQTFALKIDCRMSNQPYEISANFEGIIGQRLALLSYLNTNIYNFVLTSAIMGNKINIALIKEILEIPDDEIQGIIKYLVEHDYIIPFSSIYYEFKCPYLWETIMSNVRLKESFMVINEKILNFLKEYTLNTVSILAIIAQNLKQPILALEIWTKIVRYCAYIGDINLYVVAQKQCLALINELDDKETLKIRYNISERLGKILTDIKPADAMEYLPDAINNAKLKDDTPKEIELLGYMKFCCNKVGNYSGEIECTDAVLEKVKDLSPLNIALLKCTKLNALLNIGNCGEIINIIDNEILPVFDEFFNNKPNNYDPILPFVFETWVKTYLILAKTLILQGNNRSFNVLNKLFEIIKNHKVEDELFICKCKLALALANTVKGDYKTSDKILEETIQTYHSNIMDNEAIIQWNFIDLTNRFLTKHYEGMPENLFQIVTFANNNGDNFTKNILKVYLGKIFKDNNLEEKAMDIFNEQIVYFAKEKMAFGALLTWYMITDATHSTEGVKEAIEIANKALEVAESPNIQNFYCQIMLRMTLAKCFMTISDFDSARINLNTSLEFAQKYDLQDLLSRIYYQYGNYYRELGSDDSPQQKQYINGARKMYGDSAQLAKLVGNGHLYSLTQTALDNLDEFIRSNKL